MMEFAALVVSLVGWFVTPVITKSINAACEYAKETKESFKEVSSNLENLARQLKVIKKTVNEAQLHFINKGEGEEILWGLKGAIDEADEILDLFEYKSLKRKPKGISSKFALHLTCLLKSVLQKLDSAGDSARGFLQDKGNVIQDSAIFREARETGQSTRDDFFFGYHQQHRDLMDLLQVEQNKVIAIIGHGGMGKTHLARQLYHANQSKFDVRIWAHVGNKSGQLDLLTQLCKSANSNGSLSLTVPHDPNVAVLESMLEGLLKPQGRPQRSCLVILDDVWQHEDHGSGITRSLRDEAWRSVLAMFEGLKNCKVVMTTRDKVCSTTVNANPTVFLDGISEEIMSQLLEKYIAKFPQECKVVLPQYLAQRIAGKVKGSPRGAISIVDKLKTANSETQKANMKHSILGQLENSHHIQRLYEDHLFTFRHLPPLLQSCLAFCSIFPFDWRFHPEKLTKMWLAHGIIDDTEVQVAEGYFDHLVDRSLFKQVRDGRYVIHVHIHSMLRRVSRSECIIIDNGSSSTDIIVPATVRHLSVTTSCLAKLKPERAKKSGDEFTAVRTLVVFTDKEAPSSPWSDICEANRTLRKFKRVKVLDLTDTHITRLPDSVGELKHLRYLGFPNTVEQPRADGNKITKLLLLETVYVSKPRSPAADMDMEMDMEGIAKIGGIGKLEKLQGSLEFHVHNKNHKNGHTMLELGKMNSISRTLSIKGVQAVQTKKEAQEARLAIKASLQVLKLDWENDADDRCKGKGNGCLVVLGGLQPHANLRELHITRYPGKKLPTWLWQMTNLTSLYLTSCTCYTELKSDVDRLKQDFPHLSIVIDGNQESTAADEPPVQQPRVPPSSVNSGQQGFAPRPPLVQQPRSGQQGYAPRPPPVQQPRVPPSSVNSGQRGSTTRSATNSRAQTTDNRPVHAKCQAAREASMTRTTVNRPPVGIEDVYIALMYMVMLLLVFHYVGIRVVILLLLLICQFRS
ncbi:hypothetical protein ACQJBY_037789 [Aegilops geniculata]